jgi:hypothetical protein
MLSFCMLLYLGVDVRCRDEYTSGERDSRSSRFSRLMTLSLARRMNVLLFDSMIEFGDGCVPNCTCFDVGMVVVD